MHFLCFPVVLVDWFFTLYLFVGPDFMSEEAYLLGFVKYFDGFDEVLFELLQVLIVPDVVFHCQGVFYQPLYLRLFNVFFLYLFLEGWFPVVLKDSRIEFENVPLAIPRYLKYLLYLLQPREFFEGLPSLIKILFQEEMFSFSH